MLKADKFDYNEHEDYPGHLHTVIMGRCFVYGDYETVKTKENLQKNMEKLTIEFENKHYTLSYPIILEVATSPEAFIIYFGAQRIESKEKNA